MRNCAIDAYRKTWRETSVPAERMPGAPTAGPSGERLRISQAIEALPRELREPFVVIEVLGFTYDEASSILGVKLGTVKSRMHRARARLVRALSEGEAANEV